MGRGLEAILSVAGDGDRDSDSNGARAAVPGDELRDVAVELIAPSSKQPRRHFDDQSLQALAGSLGERGVLQRDGPDDIAQRNVQRDGLQITADAGHTVGAAHGTVCVAEERRNDRG